MINFVDPDQTPRVAASAGGLHCLLRQFVCPFRVNQTPHVAASAGGVHCLLRQFVCPFV